MFIDYLEFEDELDNDDEMPIGIYTDGYVYINKDDAIKLIEHLQKVFNLKEQ